MHIMLHLCIIYDQMNRESHRRIRPLLISHRIIPTQADFQENAKQQRETSRAKDLASAAIEELQEKIQQLKEDELNDKKSKHFEFVQQARNQTLDRLSSRKLERFITQYQCSQGLTQEQIDHI